MENQRKKTRQIRLGNLTIGGDSPIVVQSMTKTDTRDASATTAQIHALEAVGCEAVRVAVVDMEAAEALRSIKSQIHIPLIADIHFDHRLALKAIANGVDGLRINPGNIGGAEKIKAVVSAAKDKGIPIRIGVNGGSLEKHLLQQYGHPTAEALVQSAAWHIGLLEDLNFTDIKVSLKASDVRKTVEAYRLFAQRFDYPTHIGISEAGPLATGTIKSAVGLGVLLYDGIGDTMRVSLTANPVEEIRVAYAILKSLGLRQKGADLVSCPTCGRCAMDIRSLAGQVESYLAGINKPIKVAVMGCPVNGPGEAKEADIGIAGGAERGILFKKGKVVKKIAQHELLSVLIEEINAYEIE
jgi:(E)-4-hydroxy-3-methylbut-2-enyl-diphosphate synthase